LQITEELRAQAREEAAQRKRRPMSASALAKLRKRGQDERAEAAALVRFQNAVASIEPTPENLAKLISRCSADHKQLNRRAHKLACWLQKLGRILSELSPSDISLLSALTPDEARMTDGSFQAQWLVKEQGPARPRVRTCKRQRPSRQAKEAVWASADRQKTHLQVL